MKNRDKKGKEFEIPKSVKSLVKLEYKSFKKKEKDNYDSKKDLKKGYYLEIIDKMPDAIALLIKYGNVEAVKEIKPAIYEKIFEEDFIKYLKKQIEDDVDIKNLTLLPILIKDVISEAKTAEEANKEEYDVSDIVSLSTLILKKKLKKFKKEEINEGLAFDLLSVIPNDDVMKYSSQYRLRQLFTVLYESAKDENVKIDFEKIIDLLKIDEYINTIILFALLERKEKIQGFNESQKALFNSISEFCFKKLEQMKKDEIRGILNAYIDARKKDDAQGKDGNRRYYISSLPENDYKKILSVVADIAKDDEVKKYL